MKADFAGALPRAQVLRSTVVLRNQSARSSFDQREGGNTMEGSHGTCGGNRRRFLKAAAASGAALASADRLLSAAPPEKSPVPLVTLGKTGQRVTKLGMGTSWALDQSFVQAALFAGVRYIDT